MRNCRLFHMSNHTLYHKIPLNRRVLLSMSGIARFLGSAYKHMNSVLRDICEQIRSGTIWDALGCRWMLWDARNRYGTLQDALRRSGVLRDARGHSGMLGMFLDARKRNGKLSGTFWARWATLWKRHCT